jgi:hypothetical protein
MIQTQNGVFTIFRSALTFAAAITAEMATIPNTPKLGAFQKHFKDFIAESEAHLPTDGGVRCYGMLFTSLPGNCERPLEYTPSLGLLFYVDLKLEEMGDFDFPIVPLSNDDNELEVESMIQWFGSMDFRHRSAVYLEKLFKKFEFFAAFSYGRHPSNDAHNFVVASVERVFSSMTADAMIRDLHLMDTFVCDMIGAPSNWVGRDSRRPEDSLRPRYAGLSGTDREPGFSWQARRPVGDFGDDAIKAGIRGMARGVFAHAARDGAFAAPGRKWEQVGPHYRMAGAEDDARCAETGHAIPDKEGRFVIDNADFRFIDFALSHARELGTLNHEELLRISRTIDYVRAVYDNPLWWVKMDHSLLIERKKGAAFQIAAYTRVTVDGREHAIEGVRYTGTIIAQATVVSK